MMEWQDWDGGQMPVGPETFVGLVFRNGNSVVAEKAGGFEWQHAPDFDPTNPRHPGWWDIMRFQDWPA